MTRRVVDSRAPILPQPGNHENARPQPFHLGWDGGHRREDGITHPSQRAKARITLKFGDQLVSLIWIM